MSGNFCRRLIFFLEVGNARHCIGAAVEHSGTEQLTRKLDVLFHGIGMCLDQGFKRKHYISTLPI